jgi:hypothetical protein
MAFGVLVSAMAALSQPASARICKDGLMHYKPSAPHANRVTAERDAIANWRQERVVLGLASSGTPPAQNVRCLETRDGKNWRCYVQGAPCNTS